MADAADNPALFAMAEMLGLDLPEACLPGIAQNLDLLRHHIAVLDAAPPAPEAAE